MEGHETYSSDDFECNSLFKPLPMKPSFASKSSPKTFEKDGKEDYLFGEKNKERKRNKGEKEKKKRERKEVKVKEKKIVPSFTSSLAKSYKPLKKVQDLKLVPLRSEVFVADASDSVPEVEVFNKGCQFHCDILVSNENKAQLCLR